MPLIPVRLQGGPFDGARNRCQFDDGAPERIYVQPCAQCKAGHWYPEWVHGAEIYRQDDYDRRKWLVYVFLDSTLEPERKAQERELVPAGGHYGDLGELDG